MKTKNVTFKEKTGLFLAFAGNAPMMGLLSSFFMIYYTTVVGLDPAALATLFLISKVVDGISDPIMGFLMDKFPVAKHGKFRPMLVLGTIICVINYILVWFGAVWFPGAKYLIVYATYLLLGWTFDIMDISKNSLIPVMTADTNERNGLALTSALGNLFCSAVLGIAAPLIVAEGTLESYYILIFGSMVFVLICSILGAVLVKERVPFEGSEEESYSIKDMFKFLKYRPIWSFFVMALVVGVASSIGGGVGTFFFVYIIGDMTKMSLVIVISLITSLVGMLIAPTIANHLGKKKVFLIAIAIAVSTSFIRLIDVESMLLIYISTFFGGVAGGTVAPILTSMQADNTSYVQKKTGARAEAAIASLTSFIAKAAQGIGGAIPGYILSLFGFVAGSGTQPDSVKFGIILCAIIAPAVINTIGAILFGMNYRLED